MDETSRIKTSLKKTQGSGGRTFEIRWLVPAVAAMIIIVFLSAPLFPALWRGTGQEVASEEFKITGNMDGESASYASVVYIDGYVYSPIEWLKYSRYSLDKSRYEAIKDEKLGEVTLDLKGKRYTGIPPNFSSTHDLGTQIYSIKNVKKERAVLVNENGYMSVFYRERKATASVNTSLNLTVSDVFKMIADSEVVSSIELRDERDGSWLRTSEDEYLLSLINKELPALALLNSSELGKNPYNNGNRVPVNLIFSDGAALHMQAFPEKQCASVFGGFISISPELSKAIRELSEQGSQYQSISSLLGYEEADVTYLYFVNHINGDNVVCENPQWSRTALFSILNYYRIDEIVPDSGAHPVMSGTIGISKEDSKTITFYEATDKHIVVEYNGSYYKPVKGQIVFEELHDYLYNSTDLGFRR